MGIIHNFTTRIKRKKHKALAAFACLALFLSLDSSYLTSNKKSLYIKAKFQNIDRIIELPGDVEAQISVAIKSRIEGKVKNIFFIEDQIIKAGDILYEIDSSKYLESLKLAQNQLELDQTITNPTERTIRTKIDLANLEFAQLQLTYCNIASPIDGKAAKSNIIIGDEIKTGTELTNIYKTAPVMAKIHIPKEYANDALKAYNNKELTITVKDDDGKEIKNATIIELSPDMLKLAFPNQDQALWPNKTINAQLKLYTVKDAVIVPAKAVWKKDGRDYVWIDKTPREVYIDFSKDQNIIIKSGVKEGEKIMVESITK